MRCPWPRCSRAWDLFNEVGIYRHVARHVEYYEFSCACSKKFVCDDDLKDHLRVNNAAEHGSQDEQFGSPYLRSVVRMILDDIRQSDGSFFDCSKALQDWIHDRNHTDERSEKGPELDINKLKTVKRRCGSASLDRDHSDEKRIRTESSSNGNVTYHNHNSNEQNSGGSAMCISPPQILSNVLKSSSKNKNYLPNSSSTMLTSGIGEVFGEQLKMVSTAGTQKSRDSNNFPAQLKNSSREDNTLMNPTNSESVLPASGTLCNVKERALMQHETHPIRILFKQKYKSLRRSNVKCRICHEMLFSYFDDRYFHVVNRHMESSEVTADDYHTELGLKMQRAFPKLHWDESCCIICSQRHKTGRYDHVRKKHLGEQIRCQCPPSCNFYSNKIAEIKNHLETVHKISVSSPSDLAYRCFEKCRQTIHQQIQFVRKLCFPVESVLSEQKRTANLEKRRLGAPTKIQDIASSVISNNIQSKKRLKEVDGKTEAVIDEQKRRSASDEQTIDGALQSINQKIQEERVSLKSHINGTEIKRVVKTEPDCEEEILIVHEEIRSKNHEKGGSKIVPSDFIKCEVDNSPHKRHSISASSNVSTATQSAQVVIKKE